MNTAQFLSLPKPGDPVPPKNNSYRAFLGRRLKRAYHANRIPWVETEPLLSGLSLDAMFSLALYWEQRSGLAGQPVGTTLGPPNPNRFAATRQESQYHGGRREE